MKSPASARRTEWHALPECVLAWKAAALCVALWCPDPRFRTFQFVVNWKKDWSLGTIDNMQGYRFAGVFRETTALIVGISKDARLTNAGHGSRSELMKNARIPRALRDVAQSSNEITSMGDQFTFCIWTEDGRRWLAPDWCDNSAMSNRWNLELVGTLVKDPAAFIEWAKHEFEFEDVPSGTADCFAGVPMTKALIRELRPVCTEEVALAEAKRVGYPVAGGR